MDATIVTLPGDGIGPEVVAEGVRALEAVAARFGHRFDIRPALLGGCAIDATGSPLPDETLQLARGADAVLLGAVGGPRWDRPDATVRPEQGILGIRKALGLFANLRPVSIHPRLIDAAPLRPERLAGVDLLVVRELTGGIYFGEHRREQLPDGGERAVDECVYTTDEIVRIVRVAGEAARARRGRVVSVDKANVLETSRLWRRVSSRVMADEFPEVRFEHMLVDSCAMHLLRRPADFDVIVTENMFGDILTDEAAMLAGSLGMLPSASLGTLHSVAGRPVGLYAPIHGSAPDIAGQGIANPMATVLSVALLLRMSLGLAAEAAAVEAAVWATLDAGAVTADVAAPGATPATTGVVGRAIAAHIAG